MVLTIYFPYISDTFTNGTWGNCVVTAHLGISYSQARPIATSFNALWDDVDPGWLRRCLAEESVVISPLTISDGEFTFVTPNAST